MYPPPQKKKALSIEGNANRRGLGQEAKNTGHGMYKSESCLD